ncbi:MAG: hypothetical protein H6825_09265 [Planctomycetes bacterium]|nr:hypothetical protein [Planctomycetota bacterium]
MTRRAFAVLLFPSLTVLAPVAGAAVGDLVDVVPVGAYSVWHRVASQDTALADRYFYEVVDAVLDAHFDEVALDAISAAGAPRDTLDEMQGVRDAIAGILGSVPWRDLVQNEFVVAESYDPPFLPEFTTPSYLFACRPKADRVQPLEDALAGFLTSVSAIAGSDVTYTRGSEPGHDGLATQLHTLSVPALSGMTVLQMAFHDGQILVGVGPDFFDRALALASGGEGQSLAATERWAQAFRGLPADAPTHVFVDMHQMMNGLHGLAAMLAQREYDAGLWQSVVNDVFDLVDFVDLMGVTTHCEGNTVVTETVRRISPEAAERNPIHKSSAAAAYSGELLDYVPSDVIAFDTRGAIDLLPMYHYLIDRLRDYLPEADDVLWDFDVLQAAVDFDVEHDLLAWMGSEHISMEIPSLRKHAGADDTDTVSICLLRDPAAARKCLDRMHAVYAAAAPRLLGELQDHMRSAGIPFVPDVRFEKSTGMFPQLYEFQLSVGSFPIPKLSFGVLGNLLVATTSEDALDHCMAVAAGDFDGISARPELEHLLEGGTFAGAGLRPVGRNLAKATQIIGGLGGMAQGIVSSIAPRNDPQVQRMLGIVTGVLPKITGVLQTIDFLGDEVHSSELREGGLVCYERSTQYMLTPEQRPSYVATNR